MERPPIEPPAPAPGSSARKQATIYDIAREAGVSHQSVSRFMRGFDQRQGTRERIEQALRHLEYQPNLAARSLVTGRSNRLGAVTHELDQVGPSQVLHGASSAAREAGYLLDVVAVDVGSTDEMTQALTMLLSNDLAGVVVLASTDIARTAIEQFTAQRPVLLVAEADEPLDRRQPSALNGVPLVLDHLTSLGHTDFAYIGGPAAWSAARNRRAAYLRLVRERGARSTCEYEGDWSAQSGHRATEFILRRHRPTAIVAANDQMALGAILAATDHGLAVPGDISITGLDDTPESAFYSPPLTTVRIDFRAEGRHAVAALLSTLGSPIIADPPIADPRLVVRRSTAPPRRGARDT